MKAAIYNPYWDTLGGGERYTLAVAALLQKRGYGVFIEWKDASIKQKLERRFGINLNGINFVADVKRGDSYDLCFWLSDGSIPALKSRKNILHFQVPFHNVNGKTLLNRMKLFRINKIVCNSLFTKKNIDKEFGVDGLVIYPPVDIGQIKPKKKENIVLSVGRFSQLKQSKRQDILIETFKKIYNSQFDDWKLILAGGVEVGSGEFVKSLKKKAGNYPITILESPSFKEIKELYARSRLFWTASGFGINEEKEPEKVEHFGISLVEAMAGGAVCLAYDAGGHREIITDKKDGFLWKSVGELVNKTKYIIQNKQISKEILNMATKRSSDFGYERFEKEFSKIL